MATDFGPATGNGELQVGANATAIVFIEQHIATLSTPLTTGVPEGLLAPASGNNNLGPADHSFVDASAYGTKPDGSAVSAQFYRNFPIANPSGGASAINCFTFKNPA